MEWPLVRALGINPNLRAVTPGHPAALVETDVLPDPALTQSKSELSSLISDPLYHSASENPFLPLNSSDNICSTAAWIKQERTKNRNNFLGDKKLKHLIAAKKYTKAN